MSFLFVSSWSESSCYEHISHNGQSQCVCMSGHLATQHENSARLYGLQGHGVIDIRHDRLNDSYDQLPG